MAFTIPPASARYNLPRVRKVFKPGTVPVDSSTLPTPMTNNRLSFRMYMHEKWVDITPFVEGATWRYGDSQQLRIGGVARPSDGTLLIDNSFGEWNTFNPHADIDPTPAVPVQILWDEDLMFTGWTKGVQSTDDIPQSYIAVIPLYGIMYRLSEHGDGIYARLNGTPLLHDVFAQMLAEMEHDGVAEIHRSDLRIRATLLNIRGVLGSQRQRANFLEACRLISVLEGGRIYDDRSGSIVFEAFNSPRGTKVIPDKSVTVHQDIFTLDPEISIVNSFSEEADQYTTKGEQTLNFIDQPYPIDITVPPNVQGHEVILDVDLGDARFIESWNAFTREDSYDADAPLVVRLYGEETRCRIIISNNSNVERVLSITDIRGEPFKVAYRLRLADDKRSSIAKYGRKHITYPAELPTDINNVRARVSYFLNKYDGLPIPVQSIKMIKRFNPYDADEESPIYDISDLVSLTWHTDRKEVTNDHPFWVNECLYTYTSEGELTLETTMEDAWGDGRIGEFLVGTLTVQGAYEQLVGTIVLDQTEKLVGTLNLTDERLVGTLRLPSELLVGTLNIEQREVEVLIGTLTLASVPQETLIGTLTLEQAAETLVGTLALATESLVGTMTLSQEALVGTLALADLPEFLVGTIDLDTVEKEVGSLDLEIAELLVGTMNLPVPQESLVGTLTLASIPEELVGTLTINTVIAQWDIIEELLVGTLSLPLPPVEMLVGTMTLAGIPQEALVGALQLPISEELIGKLTLPISEELVGSLTLPVVRESLVGTMTLASLPVERLVGTMTLAGLPPGAVEMLVGSLNLIGGGVDTD